MQLTDTQHPLAAARLGPDEEARASRSERKRRRVRRKRLRTALFAFLSAAVVATVTIALLPKPVPVDLARVARRTLAVEVRETGQTRVKDAYVVSAPVAGSLLRMALETNDPVREGSTVAQIAQTPAPLLDPRSRAEAEARLATALSALKQADAQVAVARTASDLARTELARAAELLRTGSAARSVLDQAQFTARMRESELASAVFARKVAADQVRLARAALAPRSGPVQPVEVVSPVSGNVLQVLQPSAAVVSAGTPLLRIGDLSGLEVVVDLLTTDAVRIEPGTPVTIEGWGGEHGIGGRVRKVELAAFTRPSALGVDEQRTSIVIVLAEPRERWATLGDGYRVEVRIVAWEGRNVVTVPQGAVFRRGDDWAAFRIEDGTARLTPVRIGHRGETDVEVLSGLTPGVTVILDPGDRVEDGIRVRPR